MKAALGRIQILAANEHEARAIALAKLVDMKGQDFVDTIKIECAPHFCKDENAEGGISLGWLCSVHYKTSREYRAFMAQKEVVAA